MVKLENINTETELLSGTIIRIYNTERFDVIKKQEDYFDSAKKERDFYDYMIIDVGIIKRGSYVLVNITANSTNKGTLLWVIENIDSKGYLSAKIIKEYFTDTPSVFVLI
jgi:hypothetical protein